MALDPQTDYWTWLQFNAAVDALCPLECKRLLGAMNTDGSSVFYRNQIRQAVLDLCSYIPEFNKNNESIYYEQDFVPDGEASVGTLPPMAQFESAWFYSTDRQRRFPVKQVPWERRFELAEKARRWCWTNPQIAETSYSLDAYCQLYEAGAAHYHHELFFMAISPKHTQFYLHPQVTGPWVFSLFWDGQKLDFRDTELVPLEEEAAAAAAFFVQAQFAKYVDKDLAMAQASGAQYSAKRSNIYLRTKMKGLTV